ncbi:vacuolar protein sorting 55 (VPS55) family protein [Carex rostrata]
MAQLSRSMVACMHSAQLALLAILVSGGIVLQILACALYGNWWPMLTVVMYVLLPMPLLFFAGNDSSSVMSDGTNAWANFTKFLTGASIVGSIAIPSILKHAGIIGWGALAMELSSFAIFAVAILWCLQMSNEHEYSAF